MAETQTTKQSLVYAPSSLEKKRAVVMYGLFGIIVMIGKKEISNFEYFHLKQASGWWIIFIFFFIISSVIFFIPMVKFLGLVPLFAMIVVWAILIKQAWDGKFYEGQSKGSLQVFSSVGTWMLDLFEIGPKTSTKLKDPDVFVGGNNNIS